MNLRPVFSRAVHLLLAGAPAMALPVGAQEYQVNLEANRLVRFVSQTTLDEFEGVTDQVDGYVLLDSERLSQDTGRGHTELYFEVDLGSLETGIGLRNRHMRANYLETDRYPYAVYSGELKGVSVTETGFSVTARGTLSIHGIDRPAEVPCRVSPVQDGYRVTCAFQVLLSDYDIEIPKVMFLKLANDIDLDVDFMVRPAGGSE
jgi:polyisoprenoid-binding protein YceI